MTPSTSSKSLSLEASSYFFHHIFLPPQLPQGDDYNFEHETGILETVIDILQDFIGHLPAQYIDNLATITTMMSRLREICDPHGGIDKLKLMEILAQLNSQGGLLPIYVREQNAGMLLARHDNTIHVESFELSPRNESVLTTLGRLQRGFPGSTLALDLSTFNEPGFCETLSQTLAQMSHEPVAGTKPKVRKAHQDHDEDRDTTDPKMVTDLIMAFLRPQCTDIETAQIYKSTREEVMWFDSRSPWRRSALWLLIRVVLQLAFRRLADEGRGEDFYKQFMVYFLSSVISRSSREMSCESIHVMNCKVGRRLLKLNLSDEPSWFNKVQTIIERASKTIEDRWGKIRIQSSRHLDLRSLENLQFDKDILCQIPLLDQYLLQVEQPVHSNVSTKYQPHSTLLKLHPTELPRHITSADAENKTHDLAIFEDWVASNLDPWLNLHQDDEATCAHLGKLMKDYHRTALSYYSKNPEAVSVMLLTLIELWIACDKSAIHIYKMLKEYDTYIPVDLLHSLVLPFRSQMIRLARAEDYLHHRQQQVKYPGLGIFQNFGTPSCFSVRYFNQSATHQRLYQDIEKRAEQEREEKKFELRRKQAEYNRLKKLASEIECKYEDFVIDARFGYRESRHTPSCLRCRYNSQAGSIKIEIHEWPLPANQKQAQSTVFELEVPQSFGHWRDASLFLLLDVFAMEYVTKDHPAAQYRPESYHGLARYFSHAAGSLRVGLLSQVKPHTGTHRRHKPIICVTEHDICLENGLRFQYFDQERNCFMGLIKSSLKIPKLCTYTMPQSSSSLQQFVFRAGESPNGPSPNTVIATQFSAPSSMSVGEYKALATLPLGMEIQWQNILLQLAAPLVDLKKVETTLFILQIINQAGPPLSQSELRKGHKVLGDGEFTTAFLCQVKEVINRIRENWELVQGLSALIFLVLKVFSLSPSLDVRKLCLDRLRELRQTAFDWVNLINEKASQTTNDKRRTNLAGKSVHLALVCTETYNVEDPAEVFTSPADVSIFIQCSILVHDRRNTHSLSSDPLLPILYRRWQVSTLRFHSMLANIIVHHRNQGLDLAIKEGWSAFCTESPWSLALEGLDFWLVTTTTSSSDHKGGMLVHFNLLNGELLVDGVPLAHLPSDYERHDSYRKLFGRSHLEVMPSNLSGMRFSCQKRYMDHIVHLGKGHFVTSEESELLITAINDDQTWKFVPSTIFRDIFPDAFVKDCVHWYSVNDGDLEFRPAQFPWVSSDCNWRLKRNPSEGSWYLGKGGSFLICLSNPTAKAIANVFGPIEKASKLHCVLHSVTSTLNVHVPRLRLEFNLQPQKSSIQSHQYPDMIIDADQSLCSLVGLDSKLLLIHTGTRDRVLLIPDGDPILVRHDDHRTVEIKWQPKTDVHGYSVDDFLGRLVDNGSLQSKLFLSYLHALTSFCLPDPLTGKTGTEQALTILRSASVRSFDQIEPRSKCILEEIAKLSPKREYYPKDCRVMQVVKWHDDLGFLCQHGSFYEEAKRILEWSHRMRIFYPNTESEVPFLPCMEESLLKRDRLRSSSFRVSSFGAEDFTEERDKLYSGCTQNSSGCARVFAICEMVCRNIPRTPNIDVEKVVPQIWDFLSKSNMVHGPDIHIDGLCYSAELVLRPQDFIAANWCGLHRLITSQEHRPNKFQFMIWLSTAAFSQRIEMAILETIASFWVTSEMKTIVPPRRSSFWPARGYQLERTTLHQYVHTWAFEKTPENELKPEKNEPRGTFLERRSKAMQKNRASTVSRFIDDLFHQWPIRSPKVPKSERKPRFDSYIDVQRSMAELRKIFAIKWDNKELREYLGRIVNLLKCQTVHHIKCPSIPHLSGVNCAQRSHRYLTLDDLLGAPPEFDVLRPQLRDVLHKSSVDGLLAPQLMSLVESLEMQAKSLHEEWYVKQLHSSVDSLQKSKEGTCICLDSKELEGLISNNLSHRRKAVEDIYNAVVSHMISSNRRTVLSSPSEIISSKVFETLAKINHGPRVSPTLLLEQLTRYQWPELPENWRKVFIAYGCSITTLQRAQRLAGLIRSPDELALELQNPGHMTWDPFDFPEHLLLEIENGILIRAVQDQISRQMRDSSTGGNIVMQLNMGEGKSSVIVPITATALADGSSLVRVIVAKPQSRQMFHMLVTKLGGLLGRRVFHLPISRSLQLDQVGAQEIEHICQECMSQGGVLLVQPEHILSLKLMCLECVIAGKDAVAQSLLRTLRFFYTSSRDIVDESDENFNVKFELIYTMGVQSPVELSPQRWTVIQEVLRLVQKYAPSVERELPRSIEVNQQPHGGVPRIRLLHRDAEKRLVEHIATHVCEMGLDCLPISRQPKHIRDAVLAYMMKPNPTVEEIATVESSGSTGFWTDTTEGPLLLLRGLLAKGVLAFCFGQKRWRVNYGSDPNRDPPTRLSVPYRAKDSPSLRSEFSHPDVVIVLTSLDYYYAGLDDKDLFLAFEHLVKSDHADTEYRAWVNDAPKLELAYHQLVGVNLEDRYHCVEHIFPALRFSKVAIDYFLAQIVFPKEMKEFPDKLSASGWDLGEIKKHPTAGFSGTNDSRKTLPLSVRQLDLPERNHTNALVLEYLLQPENSVSLIPDRGKRSNSDAQLLLQMAADLDPPVQVILDVGAQILELTNFEVASEWLSMLPQNGPIQAVVFINDSDEICVLDRNSRVEPLQISPFARRMDACFVFLDEAHTRGIDLKLPSKYRAMVTLGAGITKDKLVQACMRMRKLGRGQSVVFCIPMEIEFKILALRGKRKASDIDVQDVLCWAVSETWTETQRQIPLWAVQGRRFERQSGLWNSAHQGIYTEMNASQATDYLEPESQTLDDRYRPRDSGDRQGNEPLLDTTENMKLISERCREFDNVDFGSALLHEEQERELAPETECERQIQRPPQATPMEHFIHPCLRSFVSTGKLERSSGAFMPAFQSLMDTSAASCLDSSQFPTGLLVTKEFTVTVAKPKGARFVADAFQRPVGWVLTRSSSKANSGGNIVAEMVIISPYEANFLLPAVQKSQFVTLHSYAPRQNEGFAPLDRLALYNVSGHSWNAQIPNSLRIQLNLFAGQLYLESFSDYQLLCDFLGIASVKTPDGMTVAADGFIIQDRQKSKTTFSQSPVKFVEILMSQIRKDCQKIDKTHLGQILKGRLLCPSDFPDPAATNGSCDPSQV